MNDLDAALRATYEARSRIPEPPALLDEVLAIPDLDTPRQRSWLPQIDTGGFTMFSALKFATAAAIVALFGGFLLAGVLTTQQGDEMAPAAVTESPSPTTSEDPLAGMVTEEVEPGVERIISDGAGHVLDENIPGEINGIAIAPDGTVWLTATDGDSDEGSLVWALGQPRTYTHEHGLLEEIDDLVILADGTLLAIGHRDQVFRFDGERFVSDDDGAMLRRMPDGGLLLLMGGAAVAQDLSEGEVALIDDLHAVWEPAPGGMGWSMLGDHGRWYVGDHRCHTSDEDRLGGVTCGGGWDPWTTYLAGTSIHRLAAAPDGSVWVVGAYNGRDTGLYRIALPPVE